MDRTVIIANAGKGLRWKNYLGLDKSEVIIENDEPIINRTIRQVKQHDAKIKIISNRKKIARITCAKPRNNRDWGEANKLFSSLDFWSKKNRTIILFGDIYFTEEAMNTVMKHDKSGVWVFGRPFNSTLTGKSYGEIFAISFYPEDKKKLLFALDRVSKLEARGVIKKANVWAVCRALLKLPDDLMSLHIVGGNFVNINDWTEDFDSPQDFKTFMKKRKKAGF